MKIIGCVNLIYQFVARFLKEKLFLVDFRFRSLRGLTCANYLGEKCDFKGVSQNTKDFRTGPEIPAVNRPWSVILRDTTVKTQKTRSALILEQIPGM